MTFYQTAAIMNAILAVAAPSDKAAFFFMLAAFCSLMASKTERNQR